MESVATLSPFVSLVGSLGSTATATMGAYGSAMAENYSKQWNAQQARQGAALALAKADVFKKLGVTEKYETLQHYDALRSRQRAEYSAAGVDVNAGSALTNQVNTARMGVYEAQKAKYSRDLQAWEMEVEASNLNMTAVMNENSMRNPWLPATTAAIGGITGAFATYGSWQPQTAVSKVSETSSYYDSVPGFAPIF